MMAQVKPNVLAQLISIVVYSIRVGTTSAAECAAPFVSGNPYSNGAVVSSSVSATPHNYKCTSDWWCGNSGYGPGTVYEYLAWEKESAECSENTAAPTYSPTPPPIKRFREHATIHPKWSSGACPTVFSSAADDYTAGSLVSVKMASGYSMVYQCKEDTHLWCSMEGYEPGASANWNMAWTELGICDDDITLTPTGSPIYVMLEDLGGCPDEYQFGTEYDLGDKVAKDGLVYLCKAWPLGLKCPQAGYEPGLNVGGIELWLDAWDLTGHCSGSIFSAPTTSPNFVSLPNMGACPDDWEPPGYSGISLLGTMSVLETYRTGDKVHINGMVLECRGWPYSGHCSQAGYEPFGATSAWEDAWRVVGYCENRVDIPADGCEASDFQLPQALTDIYDNAPLPPFITKEIFATVEVLSKGWAPALALYETPITVRFTRLIDAMHWNCAAMYSTGWKDALTLEEPLLRSPSSTGTITSLHNSPARLMCMVHAWAAVVDDWIPEAYSSLSNVLSAQGYNDVHYGFSDEVDAAFDLNTGIPDLDMLGSIASDNCYSPKIMGAIVARQVTEYGRRDGYNMYGDLKSDGSPCLRNCQRFTDPTGYSPSSESTRWQPILEGNGRGFFTKQEHVTPHIGSLAKRAILSDADFESRIASNPNYNYDEESRLVAARLKATAVDDMKKAKIEFYDDKLSVVFAVIGSVVSHAPSFEQVLNFAVGLTASEYDSILTAWKAKRATDLVRPTTWIRERMTNEDFETFGGPSQGVKNIKGRDFESWVRVMPHSEHVSGSGCVCQAIKDFTEEWMALTDGSLNKNNLSAVNTFTLGESIAIPIATDVTGRAPPFIKGRSKTEPRVTPSSDLFLVEPNLTSLRDSCGESRLDGGMHFSQAVPAAYALCEGIGTQGADYSIQLLGGTGWE